MDWKDFDNNFRPAINGDVMTMIGYDAIDNSLTNIFETMQGSRRMLAEFALPIYGLLFEPVDRVTASSIADLLLGAVRKWETRIEVIGLSIDARPDDHMYNITLEYRIIGTSDDTKIRQFNTILRAI